MSPTSHKTALVVIDSFLFLASLGCIGWGLYEITVFSPFASIEPRLALILAQSAALTAQGLSGLVVSIAMFVSSAQYKLSAFKVHGGWLVPGIAIGAGVVACWALNLAWYGIVDFYTIVFGGSALMFMVGSGEVGGLGKPED